MLARIAAYTLWGALANLLGDWLLARIEPAWPRAG